MGRDEIDDGAHDEPAAIMSEDAEIYLAVLADKGFWGAIDAAIYDELDDRAITAILNSVPPELVQVRALMQIKGVLEALYTRVEAQYTGGTTVLH